MTGIPTRLTLATLALAMVVVPDPAQAHLSIIRQGVESAAAREVGDYHGGALAAGDFDGDGFDDLAMGAPLEAVGSAAAAGAVVVSWGTQLGITHQGAVVLTANDHGIATADDQFGYALAAGDFNDDGYDDLAVGAPGDDLGFGVEDLGGVYVYHGSANGLFPAYLRTQTDVPGEAREGGDRFGTVLAAGDLNDDGVDDLAVSATGEDSEAGSVCWFRGGLFGLVTGPQGSIRQSNLGGTNVAGDRFGFSLAIGNVIGIAFDGHHYDDLIIGAPYKNHSGETDAGSVYVVYGSSSGPNTGARRVYDASWGDLGGPQSGGLFGYAVAAGDLFGTGWGLAVGEAGWDVSATATNVGRVVVAPGGATDVDWTEPELVELRQGDFGETAAFDEYFGYRLVAGHFDTVDAEEDLVIGCPKDRFAGFDAGWVGVALGGVFGPGTNGDASYFQSTCNDPAEISDRFGHALCLGAFDGTGRGNLAVGAPGEDSNTGMVHIIAPWRQLYTSPFQTQLALDCENKPVFSVRPFDEVCIASTTKIMTVLIACERSQLPPSDPRHVSLDASYRVPDWIRDHVGGSLYMFRQDETMTLRDLLHCCIFPSGNDAAYAIADLLTGANDDWEGNYALTCTEFVEEMNDRAAELGMNSTLFTNPAGLDVGDHHSSAWDMATLGRAAMNNDLMASVVSASSYSFTAEWTNFAGATVSGDVDLGYGFLQNLLARNAYFRGIKPGGTPCAQITGVFAAELGPDDMLIASAFGYDLDLPRAGFYDLAAELANLGAEECNLPLVINTDALPWTWGLGGFFTQQGEENAGGSTFGDWSRAAPYGVFELFRPEGGGRTSARVRLDRSSDLLFDPSESLTFGIAPFEAHGDIVFANLAETEARFLVLPSSGGEFEFVLREGERAVLPAWGDPHDHFSFEVVNRSGGATALPMNLGIEEAYEFTFADIEASSRPFFTARLERPKPSLSDAFKVTVIGTDPAPGAWLYAAFRDEGVVTGVDADGFPEITETPAALLLERGPNPFSAETFLRFQLRESGDVGLLVYDAQGREVRRFTEAGRPAGEWQVGWDGSDASGERVPAGIYFYELRLGGAGQLVGKLTVLRR